MSQYSKFFKAYDIRGTVPEIDAKLFYWSGYSLVKDILIPEGYPTTVNIMHDCRLYSPTFYTYVVQGILDAGGQVIAMGYGASDMLYTACVLNGNPGIEITASHNPKDYHGMKIVKRVPDMLGLDFGLSKIRDFVVSKEDEAFDMPIPEVVEDVETKKKVLDLYAENIRKVGDVEKVNAVLKAHGKKLKVVADCGNGIAGMIMPILVDLYPEVEFVPLYWELDGNYPHHEPNPEILSNLDDLKKKIVEEKADFGIAFDGDGDRVVILTETGEIVKGDFLVAIFAKNLLQETRKGSFGDEFNPAVVYLQPGSRLVPEIIAENDGAAIPSKQGHIFLKQEMKKYNAVYGGEFSGHHYFGFLKGMDSGALPVALFLKIVVEQQPASIHDLYADMEKQCFISDLMSPRFPEGLTFEQIRKNLETHFADGKISYLDGISVFYPDWKFSMRPSNTEPIVRFILETRGRDFVAEKVAEVRKVAGLE